MPFTPITVVNGTTPANATWGNNAQTQYTEATSSFEQDLFTAFVFFGLAPTIDGSILNQLDVTAGIAFLLQSDGTLRRRAPTSSTQTASTPSSTYFLYLQPDGTWYWSTVNSPAANSLFIAQVATNVGGNISSVTDKRTLNTNLFNGQAVKGSLTFGVTTTWGTTPSLSIDQLGTAVGTGIAAIAAPTAAIAAGSSLGIGVYKYAVSMVSINGESLPGTQQTATTTTGNQVVNLSAIPTGVTGVIARKIYRTVVGGSALLLLTTLSDNSTTTFIDTTADGSLGAAALTHPTLGGDIWNGHGGALLAAVYGDGALAFDGGAISSNGSGTLTVNGMVLYGAGASGSQARLQWSNGNHENEYWTPQAGGAAQGHLFIGWSGTVQQNIFGIGTTGVTPAASIDANGNATFNDITKIAAQSTAGAFGVPLIVEPGLAMAVTTTGDQSLLFFTPTANGLYRVSGYAEVQHNGGSLAIIASVKYADDLSSTQTVYMPVQGTTHNPIFLDGGTSFATPVSFAFGTVSFFAKTGTNIVCHWNNPDAAPNDKVWYVVERLG